jgi:hypothetical protein
LRLEITGSLIGRWKDAADNASLGTTLALAGGAPDTRSWGISDEMVGR